MTKLAILSDLHGNLPALEAVTVDLKQFDVDHVIVPGDVISFGPFSRQVAECVIQNGWSVIRGNNEFFLIDYNTPRALEEWNDPVQFAPTLWLNTQFDHRLRTVIGAWPDALNVRFRDAPPIQFFHGTPKSPWEPIYWTMIEKTLAGTEADFVVCGHTHLPMDRQVGKWRVFNPGSVGVPLDGIFSASYMILEGNDHGWTPTFRRISFDYEPVFDEFEKSGYNKESGPIGKLVVEIYRQARPLMGFIRWRTKHKPHSSLTVDLVDEFLTTANWWENSHPAYHINMK
jgi:predicted phosphodiesterase